MRVIPALLLAYLGLGVEAAFSQAPFYQGKTITVVLGGPPAGSADLRTRAVISILPKYIPGNPVILMQYMQAGGGRQAANHVYTKARPDGLTIGSMGAALIANAVLGEPGVQYDIDKLIYLGTPESSTYYVFLTHQELGLTNLEALRSTPGIRVGAQSVGHPIYITGRLFAFMIGLKDPKFITGYGGPELDLALMRREVDARVNAGASIIKRSPDWIEKGLVNFHAGIEVPKGDKHPRYAQLPDLETFARSDKERKVMQMVRAFRLAGQNFFSPRARPRSACRRSRKRCERRFKILSLKRNSIN